MNSRSVYAFIVSIAFTGCSGEGPQATSTDDTGSGGVPASDPVAPLEEQLAALDSLPTPDGVDADLWGRLTAELARVLAERIASAPPVNEASRAALLFDGVNELSWRYASQGDYDQNGEVNISDLTPLGANFGAVGPFSMDSALSLVDGDGNGEINIADVTPIGVNFGVVTSGYNVYASSDVGDYPVDSFTSPNGPGTVLLGSVAILEATGAAGERKFFSFTVASPQPGDHYWVRPTDGVDDGTPSTLAQMGGSGNQAPIAALDGEPISGLVPLSVDFNASASNDPDGSIAQFEWEWDGPAGGLTWIDSGTDPMATHIYDTPGIYNAFVRVTDNSGAQDAAFVVITVNLTGNDPPVAALSADPTSGDAPLNVDFDASASNDPDGTIVRYEFDFDEGAGWEDYGSTATAQHTYNTAGTYNPTVRVTDDGGQTDNTSTALSVSGGDPKWHIVTANPEGGADVSLALINGKPAIAHRGGELGKDLFFLIADDALGMTWGAPKVLDNEWIHWILLVEAGGHPAVIYAAFDMRFVRANDANGDTWGEPRIVAEPNETHQRNSGAIINGKPALSYVNGAPSPGFFFVLASNPEGTSWNAPALISTEPASISYMLEVNGMPAVCYWTGTDELQYVRANNADGTNWGTPTTLFDENIGFYPAMAMVNGNPAACVPGFNGPMFYSRSQDTAGDTWGIPKVIEGGPPNYPYAGSLAVISGMPAISYLGGPDYDQLRYARADDVNGDAWPAPESVDTSGNATGQTTLIEISGNPAICYAMSSGNGGIKFAIFY